MAVVRIKSRVVEEAGGWVSDMTPGNTRPSHLHGSPVRHGRIWWGWFSGEHGTDVGRRVSDCV